jgi:AraC-like DNA-binding protein
MTRNANSLMKRATRSARVEPTWTMPARDLRVTMTGLEELGYDCDGLTAAAGLSGIDFDDPDGRVPCEAVGQLLARAQQSHFTPNLALELARLTPIGSYPLLDYLVLTSDTVGAGVRQLGCYRELVGDPATITVDDTVDPVRVEMSGRPSPFSAEYTASLMVLHFHKETDGGFSAASVSFQHEPDDAAAFERVLGCPVRTRAPWSGITVPLAAWELPLRRRDPVLRQVLEAQANGILATLPKRTGVALELQRALAAQVAGGDTAIAAMSRGLAMSSRTLQRRLAAEGVSYQELLDEARKEAAGRHISEQALAICEVAYLLGYSEPAPFHRAFRRWYGTTPDLFRRANRSASVSRAAAHASPADRMGDAGTRRRNG